QRRHGAGRAARAPARGARARRTGSDQGAGPPHLPLHGIRPLSPGGQGCRAEHAWTDHGRLTMAALCPSLRAVLAAACLAMLAACGKQDDAPAPPAPPIAAGQDQLLRGRYLVQAADCAACHTAEGGAPFAGGVPLESPFGKFYGANTTPDAEHGIGDWSADDFYAALHDGMTPDGPLYPAMPYTSYRQLSRADSDAMYAYLRSIEPEAVPNREPELDFPYNMRFGVRFWNWLFLEDSLPDASQGSSQAW